MLGKNNLGIFMPLFLVVITALFMISACQSNLREAETKSEQKPPSLAENQLLDSTFKIDILTIRVTFDYFPEQSYTMGEAEVIFKMRPGETRPVIHFDPALRSDCLSQLSLNGEELDFSNPADVRIVSYADSTQEALELQRDLQENSEHRLVMGYRLDLPEEYPRFSTNVHDIYGNGNEELYPTINTPHELSHHVLTFRVHQSPAFRCIGSGFIQRTGNTEFQEWVLDTEREVASYTVMFVLVPEADTVLEERTINGVDVRILAFKDGASVFSGFAYLEGWLPELENNLGPFPMPRGISIFLVSRGGGMEYYGGTITSLWALRHEVFHMYFGCSTVNKTYRDTWLDEAINEWYENSVDPYFMRMASTYTSNIVSGRSSIAVGFDSRAYNEGARMMQTVANLLGGRQNMIGFLRYLQENYAFNPFTTRDFVKYLKEYANIDMTSYFTNWVFNGQAESHSLVDQQVNQLNRVDMTPPGSILIKYKKK